MSGEHLTFDESKVKDIDGSVFEIEGEWGSPYDESSEFGLRPASVVPQKSYTANRLTLPPRAGHPET